MGKPYLSELEKLQATLAFAADFDDADLKSAIEVAMQTSLPLAAVGSGGSLTAAHLAASVHRRYARRIATVLTPLETVAAMRDRDVAAWLISAGGGNVDILAALSVMARLEPRQLVVLCGRIRSKLVRLSSSYSIARTVIVEGPAGRDGFLATNSLLAFSVVICRAYAGALGLPTVSLDQLRSLLLEAPTRQGKIALWREACKPLWSKKTVLVLHGSATHAAAVDLESKFTEAALGQLQLADYRNFGHGRHHWLAKHGDQSAILAFTTPEDLELANRTLALIPKAVPAARIDVDGGFIESALNAIVASLFVAGWAGQRKRIDPGRPGVPEFGRRLFHLGSVSKLTSSGVSSPSKDDAVAIERKSHLSIDALSRQGSLELWREALKDFKLRLQATEFKGVVLDYDGTIVDRIRRFGPVGPLMGRELNRLLQSGAMLGIATGRGGSARDRLREAVAKDNWSRVIVGYYNGAEIGSLDDDSTPAADCSPSEELKVIVNAVRARTEFRLMAKESFRKYQLTLEPRGATRIELLWRMADQLVRNAGQPGVTVVQSSHSVDVLAPGVSKKSVVEAIASRVNATSSEILKIADRGQWPGNDFYLLSEPCSLSVDETSADLTTCWNLAGIGQRGAGATLMHLQDIDVDRRGVLRVPTKVAS